MKALEIVFMASVDNNKPRVRTMALIKHEKKWWCCTKASRQKINQFRKNPKFEFCNIIKHETNIGSIRARGNAIIIDDLDIKRKVSNSIPFFKGYWDSPKDPNFILINLDIEEILVQSPFDKKFYDFAI